MCKVCSKYGRNENCIQSSGRRVLMKKIIQFDYLRVAIRMMHLHEVGWGLWTVQLAQDRDQ